MLIRTPKEKNTRRGLLKDLAEITSVLEVEAQLVKALIRMAIARESAGLGFGM